MSNPMTLAQKVWDQHVVHSAAGDADLLYIDLHLVHEVTSPQALDGLRLTGHGLLVIWFIRYLAWLEIARPCY